MHFPTAPNDDEDALTPPEALQARLQRFLPTGHDFDIVGCNLYTVHQRVAQKFRAGRAILAGDSAHVNSPIGAMGMNSGVHDAFNLADKLDRHPAWRSRATTCSTATSASAATSPCSTPRRRPSATSALLAEKDPAVRRRTTTSCAARRKTRSSRARSCCAASLIDSLREAEQIT